jgi:hypothetical protein
MEEDGVPGENQQPVASHWETLPNYDVSSTPHHKWDSDSQLPYDHDHD